MDWQQKAAALDALSEISICIRKPGDWFVSQKINIRAEHVLIGGCGNGETPEDAVNDHWHMHVEGIENSPQYLIVRSGLSTRRAVRWNGFMWADVIEPNREGATQS